MGSIVVVVLRRDRGGAAGTFVPVDRLSCSDLDYVGGSPESLPLNMAVRDVVEAGPDRTHGLKAAEPWQTMVDRFAMQVLRSRCRDFAHRGPQYDT